MTRAIDDNSRNYANKAQDCKGRGEDGAFCFHNTGSPLVLSVLSCDAFASRESKREEMGWMFPVILALGRPTMRRPRIAKLLL